MKIACLSGKGGAGKTLTAVNLAAAAEHAVYIDCDVEEPNGRLFFQPGQVTSSQVSTLLPVFDAEELLFQTRPQYLFPVERFVPQRLFFLCTNSSLSIRLLPG